MCELGISKKMATLISDEGRDIIMPNGLFGKLEKRMKRKMARIPGDLHVLNTAFAVACEHVFGKFKIGVTSVLQLLYLISEHYPKVQMINHQC